jgi:chromosome segregation ATPase
MLPDEREVQDLRLQVGLLNKDVSLTNQLCNKLSESITKIQELNVNVMQMITLHQQKHEQHETTEAELKEDIKELHSRITTVNREIHDRIDQVERHITERIDTLRSDLIKHKNEDKGNIVEQLAEIDKWKWMLLGGVLMAGFLLGKIDLISLLGLLK